MSSIIYRPLLSSFAQASRPILLNRNSVGLSVRYFQATRNTMEQCAEAETDILRAQRKLRPCSPHLTIYQPQLTWYMSSGHRITGCAMGGALYLGSMAYLVAPLFGYHFDTDSFIASYAALPDAVKTSAKVVMALPFTYHASNGIRHLIWDAGKCLDMKGVYRTGYAVLAATTLGTWYLASM